MTKENQPVKPPRSMFLEKAHVQEIRRDAVKMDHPENSCILVWYAGYIYPEKGLPYPELFIALDPLKRMLVSFSKLFLKSPFLILYALFNRKKILKTIADCSYSALHMFKIKPQFYCPMVKEIRRRMYSVFFPLGNMCEERHVNGTELIDMVSMFLHYDNAYRYRIQDILTEMSFKDMTKRPYHEIKRVIKLAIKRDVNPGVKKKYQMFGNLLAVLSLVPIVRGKIKHFFGSMSDDVKFDNGDWYQCLCRTDYDFGGLTIYERMQIQRKMHVEARAAGNMDAGDPADIK